MFLDIFTEEPIITLEVTAHELLNCRAGTTIKIPATVLGKPIPNVTWDFDGTAPTEKKNERHTLPEDSEVGLFIHFKTLCSVQNVQYTHVYNNIFEFYRFHPVIQDQS